MSLDVRARCGVLVALPHQQEHKGFGGDGGGVTPVPIPNTEVKPTSADGTWVETPWESRSPPDFAMSGEPKGSPLSFNCQLIRGV